MILFDYLYIYFRDILGPELVIVSLSMGDEDRNRRLMERHEGNEQVAKFLKVNTFDSSS